MIGYATLSRRVKDVSVHLLMGPQWSRGRGQRDSEFVKARTGTALITIWRQHGLLHRFECFRHSPWAPIPNRRVCFSAHTNNSENSAWKGQNNWNVQRLSKSSNYSDG